MRHPVTIPGVRWEDDAPTRGDRSRLSRRTVIYSREEYVGFAAMTRLSLHFASSSAFGQSTSMRRLNVPGGRM
jgi:hypothetical protein